MVWVIAHLVAMATVALWRTRPSSFTLPTFVTFHSCLVQNGLRNNCRSSKLKILFWEHTFLVMLAHKCTGQLHTHTLFLRLLACCCLCLECFWCNALHSSKSSSSIGRSQLVWRILSSTWRTNLTMTSADVYTAYHQWWSILFIPLSIFLEW